MKLRFISLRTKLIIGFLVVVLFPLLGVGIYSYHEMENSLRSQMTKVASDRLHQVDMNIEAQMRSMVRVSSSVSLDDHILNILANPPQGDRAKLDAMYQTEKKFLEISTAIMNDPVYLSVFDNNGNMYSNWSSYGAAPLIRDTDWYKETLLQNGYAVWRLNHDSYMKPSSEKLVTLSMAIRDKEYKRIIGVLVISQPASLYFNILNAKDKSLGNTGYIVSPHGEILSDTENAATNEKESIVNDYLIPLTDWRVVQIAPYKQLFAEVTKIRNVTTMIVLLSMSVFIGLVIVVSHMFTRPLVKLGHMMKTINAGNMDKEFEIKTRDEIGLLGKSFNQMLKRLNYYMNREIELERRREQAKLEALQAQITPHFLHNTLNTIKWMSIMANTVPITEMLMALGHLLNMSIHRGQALITLQEEMENVHCFLTIQKYRFGEKIRVREEIDPNAVEGLVPKLSLQPLVENVFHHAVFTGEQNEMRIRVRKIEGKLCLEVMDNGESFSKERIMEILERLNRDTTERFSGIGLKNVHERIQMIFGREYGLAVGRNDTDQITRVSIELPFTKGGAAS